MAKKISKATEKILKEDPVTCSPALANEEQMSSMAHMAWKLRLQGNSYSEIGKIMGIGVTSVKNYIQSLNDEYRMEIWQDVDQFRQDLAVRLFYIANETSKMWEESKRDFSTSPAHVAYLKNTRDCIKDIRDLMGLDAPKRTEMQVSAGEVPYTLTLDLTGKTN